MTLLQDIERKLAGQLEASWRRTVTEMATEVVRARSVADQKGFDLSVELAALSDAVARCRQASTDRPRAHESDAMYLDDVVLDVAAAPAPQDPPLDRGRIINAVKLMRSTARLDDAVDIAIRDLLRAGASGIPPPPPDAEK